MFSIQNTVIIQFNKINPMKEFHFLLSLNSIPIFTLTSTHLNGRLDGVYFPPSNCMGNIAGSFC